MINQLVVIGVGLIGGSFALALREKGLVKQIVGVGRSEENLLTAKQLGIIDSYNLNMSEAVSDADLVFIATPVGMYEQVFKQLKGNLKEEAIVTDGGSTKVNVIEIANNVFNGCSDFFVPGHPIAGTENSGAKAAFSSLYEAHKIILTPNQHTNKRALTVVTDLWGAINAEVIIMDAEHHDLVLAATSHLPHALAFSLVNMLATLNEREEVFEYAAGGFKDFTRIASSDPKMWQDICLANKSSLLKHLAMYQNELSELSTALENDDADFLFNYFSRSKFVRDKLCN